MITTPFFLLWFLEGYLPKFNFSQFSQFSFSQFFNIDPPIYKLALTNSPSTKIKQTNFTFLLLLNSIAEEGSRSKSVWTNYSLIEYVENPNRYSPSRTANEPYVSHLLRFTVSSWTGFPMRVRPRRPMTRKTLPSVHMEPGACPCAKAILLLARHYNLPLTDALTTTYSRCLYLRLMSISARW